MATTKSLKVIRTGFYVGLLILNYWIYSLVLELQEQKDCLCNSGWRIENIKMIAILTMLMSLINVFIPLNKALYKIPVVSTLMTFGAVLIVFVQLFLLIRLSRQLNTAQCQDTCDINWIFEYIRNLSIGSAFIASLILGVGMLWL